MGLDLSIIRDKLESCQYDESTDCLNDLQQMFDGVRKYFKPDSVRSVTCCMPLDWSDDDCNIFVAVM